MELTNINTIKELMNRHGMRFSKALGQNFIINPSICPKIAEGAGVTSETVVLEIGPGIGVLTKELASRAKKVVSIELDTRLLPILDETLAAFDNCKIINGDILKIDLPKLFEDEFYGMEVVVCANLPYYITSPIVMLLLESNLPIKALTVMVQKEAAERICAPLPSRNAGSITVAVAYYAQPNILFHVSKGSFMPAPNVSSSVIRLDKYEVPPVTVKSEDILFKVIRGSFAQRRKTLLNSLSSSLGMEKPQLSMHLESANIPPNARAEQLTLEQFARLANEL